MVVTQNWHDCKRGARPLVLATLACALLGCPGARAPQMCLPGGHRGAGGECITRPPRHQLPFRAGFETRIMQGFHGYYSHKEDLAYSIDFRCDEGDPVVASRQGVVWAVREDSVEGCAEARCVDMANYVILDHGDGTFSEYHHLAHMGAIVEVGEQVCGGELLGVCGNTGYSSGAHLHWALSDVARQTIPASFVEMGAQRQLGLAIPEETYTSANSRELTCEPTAPSELPRAAFAHLGVLLDEPLPMVYMRGDSHVELSGSYHGSGARVAVHRKALGGGTWSAQCFDLDEEGRFTVRFDFEDPRRPPGYHWLMLTGADEDCLAPGWAWSYKVRLDDPGARARPPQRRDPERNDLRGPVPPSGLK